MIILASFYWVWDFQPENLKLTNSKYKVLNHLFSGLDFIFWETILGVLSSVI